jgi:hypothetical protein
MLTNDVINAFTKRAAELRQTARDAASSETATCFYRLARHYDELLEQLKSQ